ncbi:hypothetical protein [Paucibacter sp. B51]|nr:hypothetical protein [Paucibacter sp. B51]
MTKSQRGNKEVKKPKQAAHAPAKPSDAGTIAALVPPAPQRAEPGRKKT